MTDEEYQRFEKKAWKSLKKFVASHADELSVLWGFGDGDGGCVIETIRSILLESGRIENRKVSARNYRKTQIPRGMRIQVMERDAYRCVHCGSHKDLSIDHIFPESLGGKTELDNLQTLCRPCNSVKGNRV